jgi:hypothetical protein
MNAVKIIVPLLLVLQTGCAAGARVGGPERGIGVGAAVGSPAPLNLPPPPPPPPTPYQAATSETVRWFAS